MFGNNYNGLTKEEFVNSYKTELYTPISSALDDFHDEYNSAEEPNQDELYNQIIKNINSWYKGKDFGAMQNPPKENPFKNMSKNNAEACIDKLISLQALEKIVDLTRWLKEEEKKVKEWEVESDKLWKVLEKKKLLHLYNEI